MTKKESDQKAQEPVKKTSKAANGLVKMAKPNGQVAHVHESMIPAYKSGGYKEV